MLGSATINALLILTLPIGVDRNTAVPSRHISRNGRHVSICKGFSEDARKRELLNTAQRIRNAEIAAKHSDDGQIFTQSC